MILTHSRKKLQWILTQKQKDEYHRCIGRLFEHYEINHYIQYINTHNIFLFVVTVALAHPLVIRNFNYLNIYMLVIFICVLNNKVNSVQKNYFPLLDRELISKRKMDG